MTKQQDANEEQDKVVQLQHVLTRISFLLK